MFQASFCQELCHPVSILCPGLSLSRSAPRGNLNCDVIGPRIGTEADGWPMEHFPMNLQRYEWIKFTDHPKSLKPWRRACLIIWKRRFLKNGGEWIPCEFQTGWASKGAFSTVHSMAVFHHSTTLATAIQRCMRYCKQYCKWYILYVSTSCTVDTVCQDTVDILWTVVYTCLHA